MIISYLTDRLGNQLFQYAAARSLAVKNDTILKIDKSYYEHASSSGATYELDIFRIPQQFVTNEEITEYTWTGDSFFYRVIRKINPKSTYSEKLFYQYDRKFKALGEKVYLKGWWQSYKYFDDIEDIIRRDFTFKNEPTGLNKEYAKKISACNAVSLHVRRGDYVKNQADNEKFGTCSKDYYQSAIDRIVSRVPDPHFFIFSDDKDWLMQEMQIDFPHTFVLHNNGNNSYEDMRLMSLCKHHIIANSTFSWWGAWLNSSRQKIVIAPKNWLQNPSISTADLCPPSWIRL